MKKEMEAESKDLAKQQEKLMKLADEAGDICREFMVLVGFIIYYLTGCFFFKVLAHLFFLQDLNADEVDDSGILDQIILLLL